MQHGVITVAKCAVHSAAVQSVKSPEHRWHTHLDTVAAGQLQQVAVTTQRCHAPEVTVQRPLAESAGGAGAAHIWRAGKYQRNHDDHNQRV